MKKQKLRTVKIESSVIGGQGIVYQWSAEGDDVYGWELSFPKGGIYTPDTIRGVLEDIEELDNFSIEDVEAFVAKCEEDGTFCDRDSLVEFLGVKEMAIK